MYLICGNHDKWFDEQNVKEQHLIEIKSNINVFILTFDQLNVSFPF